MFHCGIDYREDSKRHQSSVGNCTESWLLILCETERLRQDGNGTHWHNLTGGEDRATYRRMRMQVLWETRGRG